jgi:hypothetical protein
MSSCQYKEQIERPHTRCNILCAHALYDAQALLAHLELEQGNELVLGQSTGIHFVHLNLIWLTTQRASQRLVVG